MQWMREHALLTVYAIMAVTLVVSVLLARWSPALREKIHQPVILPFFSFILIVLTFFMILRNVLPNAEAHRGSVIALSIASTGITLALLGLKYHAIRDVILLPILVGLSMVLVVLTYVTVFAATAIALRIVGRRLLPDPQKMRSGPTYWTAREQTQPTLEYLKRQF